MDSPQGESIVDGDHDFREMDWQYSSERRECVLGVGGDYTSGEILGKVTVPQRD